MATQELTPRQTEIKGLMEKGKKPKDIAKKLGISENAVYQQIRRIRSGGASGRSTSGAARRSGSTSRSRSRSTGRQSSGSRPARRAAAPRPVAVPQTAEALLKQEIAAHDAAVIEEQAKVTEAQAAIAAAEAAIEAVKVERERKAATLSVLTGEMVAHAKPKPAARRRSSGSSGKSGQSGSKSTGKAASGSQGGSQASPNGDGSSAAASGDGAGTKEGATATA